jgi:2-phospho-L-lactate guanylyltransferase
MRARPDAAEWVVVVAAKRLGAAKSRLTGVTGDQRSELALGMLLDTVAAAQSALGVIAVFVVTDDERIGAAVSAIGASSIADAPARGLNAALAHGVAAATLQYPGAGVALLAGDLPALRPGDLETALRVADDADVVVADHGGTGTTMLAARTPTSLRPSFGDDSFARHVAAGAVAVSGALHGLRRDVDEPADLAAAIELGVGPATAAVLSG